MITVTIRPGQRTLVQGVPWTGPGGGYQAIKDCLAGQPRPQWSPADHGFTVTRTRTRELITGLLERHGPVRVIQHGGTTRCVRECWDANPDTVTECVCGCAGRNHGSTRPLGSIVADTSCGELSVERDGPREYVVTPLNTPQQEETST